VGYLYLAASFGVDELKQTRLQVTPDSVSDDEFLEAWKARFEAAKGSAEAALRARCDRRRERLEADEDEDEDLDGGDD
jgi:hypothetical protein